MLYFTYTHREELLFQSYIYIYFIINDHLKVFQEESFQTVTTLKRSQLIKFVRLPTSLIFLHRLTQPLRLIGKT